METDRVHLAYLERKFKKKSRLPNCTMQNKQTNSSKKDAKTLRVAQIVSEGL
jgi:hypothetical protein